LRDAQVFEEAFVQAALDGDGAGGVFVEHHERAFVRGADPDEAQGAGVLAQVQRVLQDVEAKALLVERAVGEAREERVGQYLGVDAFYRVPQFAGKTSACVSRSLEHKTLRSRLLQPTYSTASRGPLRC
jgi:hypothetical protein